MRALIIGFGSIGQRHLRNLRDLVPGLDAIVLRRSSGEPVAGATVVRDLDAALRLDPALAVVATPSAVHVETLEVLIAAGVPSYVEKPVVTTARDVERIRRVLAAKPDERHLTGFNLRLLPSLRMARNLVQEGRLGTIARSSFSAGQWLPDWRKSSDHRVSYSGHKSEGGGVIFDLSHELDAARYFLGEIALESCIAMHLPSLEVDAESAAVMVGRAASGGLVTVNVDYVARRPIRRYELVGDKATLVWDLGNRRLEIHDATGLDVVTDQATDFDVGATYVEAMCGFVNGIAGKISDRHQSLEDGLCSSELAIRASELVNPQ